MASYHLKLPPGASKIFGFAKGKMQDSKMSLIEHLGEIRRRIIYIAFTFLLFAIMACVYVERLVLAMISLGSQFDLVYLAPAELVTCYFRLVLLIALVFSSPVTIYHLWAFIRPALSRSEKRAFFATLSGGLIFFVLGVLFAYFVAAPFMMSFFYGFNKINEIRANISFEKYMDFLIQTFLSFGLMFEFPVVATLLSKLGVLRTELLIKVRKYAILVIFIVASIMTPPDVVSQIMLALPMILLYEITILLCRFVNRHKPALH